MSDSAGNTFSTGMLNSQSVKTRFLVSVAANTTRSVLSFFSGLLVARGLNPSGYGDMTFLLGSFVAIRSLLDIGSSNAFYTFISQRRRGKQFFLYYFAWLAVQFIVPALFITVLMPESVVSRIWLGHSRSVILLAMTASFMQQQVWQTLTQIGESARKTVRVQIIGMVLGTIHFILVLALVALRLISVKTMLWLFIIEYPLAVLWSLRFLQEKKTSADSEDSPEASSGLILNEYWTYCKPLALLSLATFLGEFADRWLLQRFGGSNQQGYYQIAYQCATISLLATTSILNVFWKEIAEANALQDKKRLSLLYHRVSRTLVMLGAILSGFLIPWTAELVTLILGKAYIMAVPVLAVMFLYPIHQSMGQIGSTMLLAGGHTKAYMRFSVALMIVNLPLSYLVQAPAHGAIVPGLGLGALGMALKMVLGNILSVNVLAWIIAKSEGWKFDWLYQVVGITAILLAGYGAKLAVGLFCDLSRPDIEGLLFPFISTGVLYLAVVVIIILSMPWLIGMDRREIRSLFTRQALS